MASETILFDPELDERQLDREVGQIDDQLADVGQDVPVNFDAEEMDGLSPVGGGRGGGGGMGRGAGVAAGLASRIPKPVSGVTAASALPIALTGGVGLGMLSAMQSSSARLQTSTSLLGQAWNNVWRPIGDDVDQLFVRDTVQNLVSATQAFEDTYRNDNRLDALTGLAGNLNAQGGFTLSAAVTGAQLVDQIDWQQVGARTLVSAFPFATVGAKTLMDEVNLPQFPENFWPTPPQFPSTGEFWPDGPEFPDNFWPDVELAGWVKDIVNPSSNTETDTSVPPGREPGSTRTGSGAGTGGGGSGGGRLMASLNGGGRITQSGVAEVHRGELVTDEDRLVRELANAVNRGGQSRGGGEMVDLLREISRKLDRVESAAATTANIGDEQIARSSANGMDNRVADTNKRV
jgi:hypothetical protein